MPSPRSATACAQSPRTPSRRSSGQRHRLPGLGVHTLSLTLASLLSACQPTPPDTGWSGYAEGDVLYLAAPVAGRLHTLAIGAGQQVTAGAPLFELEGQAERLGLAEARARWQAAQAQADNSRSGRRAAERAVTQAQLDQAHAQAQRADAELQRLRSLLAQQFISPSRLDDANTAAAQAHARVAELQAALAVSALPARSDEQRSASALAEAAAAQHQQAAWRQGQTRQTAPQAGLVTEIYFRPGEWVGAGQPVLALLPPGQRKAVFFVPEPQRALLHAGQRVTLHCDGYGAPLPARITQLAAQAEYTPPVIYSNSQRSRLVFRAEAQPDAAQAERLAPGLPLEVRLAPAAASGAQP